MNLYLVTNKINSFYVLANDPTEAEKKLMARLEAADYGFYQDRVVKKIELVACEVTNTFNGRPFFCGGNLLIL